MPLSLTTDYNVSLDFTLVSQEEDFHALAAEWNPLLQASAANGLFLTWEYLSTWWAVFGADFQLQVITARTPEGRLIGIAPLALGLGRGWRRAWLRHLTFLGGECESLAERQDFIVAAGYERRFGAGCWKFLNAQTSLPWDVLRLDYARGNSPALQAFAYEAEAQQLSVRIKEHATWITQLPATWEEFLGTRSSKFREMTRKKIRKLEQNHDVKFRVADGIELAVDRALIGLIRLNHHRWKSAGSSFHTPRFVEFHRRLAPVLASQGWLSLNVLEVDGEIAAARYDFIYDGQIWGFQSGWNSQHTDLSVGHLALAYTVRAAIAQGLTAFDFQAGPAPYKVQWAEPGPKVIEMEITNPRRLRSQLYGLARKLQQRLRCKTLVVDPSPVGC
jgi:CelD/BcsL family acetyltransferase involved in cellulose biosynthesis